MTVFSTSDVPVGGKPLGKRPTAGVPAPARARGAVRLAPVLAWRAVGAMARALRRHRERIAVRTLLEWEDWRLDDVGLSRHDVMRAFDERGGSPGTTLARARADRARKSPSRR